jgi:hypothetical protein
MVTLNVEITDKSEAYNNYIYMKLNGVERLLRSPKMHSYLRISQNVMEPEG